MLDLNEARGLEQGVLIEVDRLLDSAETKEDGVKKALYYLADAVLEDPENNSFQQRLGELASSLDDGAGDSKGPFDELQHHRQVLSGFDAFLSILEERHQDSAVSAS